MYRKSFRIIITSLLLSFLLSAVLIFLLALALYRFKISEPQIQTGVYAVYGLSCLFGGFLCGKGMKSRRLPWGLLFGLFYFVILAAVSFLLTRSFMISHSRILTVLAVCISCGIAGGILS